MTQDEARPIILREISRRLPEVPYHGPTGGIVEYHALKAERPELFTFRCRGDQWQVVHGWLLNARLVTQ